MFPPSTHRLPQRLLAGGLLAGASVVAGVWYYFTPQYTRVGYQPVQPVAFSHRTHVGQLGMDCRYCHPGVETSWYSNLPSGQSCMNCHNQVLRDDARLALVRASAGSGRPIPWIQIHRLPDYVFFNHAVHVNRGVSCFDCHGSIHELDESAHLKPLSMAFCLECHRRPEAFLRPPAEVYHLDWRPESPEQQQADGSKLAREWNVQRLDPCSACHR
ncbi:MAG TPA: cytochrome c3 family protein [Verrucomicrobiota bacterium]|nr:cytochrome c3 family protein [Verrucomicrobiota bacterium]